jgi:hypothetical protein
MRSQTSKTVLEILFDKYSKKQHRLKHDKSSLFDIPEPTGSKNKLIKQKESIEFYVDFHSYIKLSTIPTCS